MSRRKIALVGIGKIARDQHIPSIAASPDWDLAAAVSRSGTVDGVANYADLNQMLDAHPEIDTVSLCMPPVPRYDYAVMALRAGRHVMLEKPPGATLSEVQALAELATAKGLTLFASWHSRAAPFVDTAKNWLRDKRIKRFAVTWKEDLRKWHPGQDWVFEPGGMGVFDPGINALSIVTEILPDPIHLRRARLDVPANRQTPIAAHLEFTHPHGCPVTAVFDWDHQDADIWAIEAETDRGHLLLENGGASLKIDGMLQARPQDGLSGEYPRLYAKMANLVDRRAMDVDIAPLRHVADAFMLGERKTVSGFQW